jgi:hypothetical protein
MVKVDIESLGVGDPLKSMGLEIKGLNGLKLWGVGLSCLSGLLAAEQKTSSGRYWAYAGIVAGGLIAAAGQVLENGAERNRQAMMHRRSR